MKTYYFTFPFTHKNHNHLAIVKASSWEGAIFLFKETYGPTYQYQYRAEDTPMALFSHLIPLEITCEETSRNAE